MTAPGPRPLAVPLAVAAADAITTMEWNGDGHRLAIGAQDGAVRLLDRRAGDPPALVAQHPMGVRAVAWDGPSGVLASGGQDGTVALHEPDRRAVDGPDMGAWVHDLAWHDGILGVASGADVSAYRWDGSLVRRWPLQAGTVLAVGWVRSQRWLVAAGAGGVRAFDPAIRSLDPVWHAPSAGAVLGLDVHPDGQAVAVADLAGEVRVLRVGQEEETVLSGYPDSVRLVTWCDHGRTLAAEADDEVTVWSALDGEPGERPLHLVRHGGRVTSLRAAPSSGLVASGDDDGEVRVWDATTGRVRAAVRALAAITAVAWSPDSRTLAVGTADGHVGLAALE